MPGMSASGNMIPQSTTRIRPSTSKQKQFRPISPSPPRNTIRTDIYPTLLRPTRAAGRPLAIP